MALMWFSKFRVSLFYLDMIFFQAMRAIAIFLDIYKTDGVLGVLGGV